MTWSRNPKILPAAAEAVSSQRFVIVNVNAATAMPPRMHAVAAETVKTATPVMETNVLVVNTSIEPVNVPVRTAAMPTDVIYRRPTMWGSHYFLPLLSFAIRRFTIYDQNSAAVATSRIECERENNPTPAAAGA